MDTVARDVISVRMWTPSNVAQLHLPSSLPLTMLASAGVAILRDLEEQHLSDPAVERDTF